MYKLLVMTIVKIGVKVSLFVLFITLSTVVVEFSISKVYSLLIEYYSLPKSDSDLTILSFIISLFFMVMLTVGFGFWRNTKTV